MLAALEGRVSKRSTRSLPRFRRRPLPGRPPGGSVYAFPLRSQPLVLVVGIEAFTFLDSRQFGALYYASNHEGRCAWERHVQRWTEELSA